jgi:hypothetical protein
VNDVGVAYDKPFICGGVPMEGDACELVERRILLDAGDPFVLSEFCSSEYAGCLISKACGPWFRAYSKRVANLEARLSVPLAWP